MNFEKELMNFLENTRELYKNDMDSFACELKKLIDYHFGDVDEKNLTISRLESELSDARQETRMVREKYRNEKNEIVRAFKKFFEIQTIRIFCEDEDDDEWD